jgi:KaiC/GvpD/RAD55 family RecA-like ATPase
MEHPLATRLTPLDAGIEGFDLVVGGGIVPVPKTGAPQLASAVVLFRGAPGSGKTIFGSHLAVGIARSRRCDVVYACVELLPAELSAQLSNFHFFREPENELNDQPGIKVIEPPFDRPADAADPRVFAGILDLDQDPVDGFITAVEASILAVEHVGGRPGVLVVDSLSDGYGLGAAVRREVADSLSKLAAERGLIAILLEETTEDRPSGWSFAADTVLELAHMGGFSEPSRERRQLIVRKNRFGPSQIGPHSFTLRRGSGAHVYPRPSAYLTYWAKECVFPDPGNGIPENASWGMPNEEQLRLPALRRSTIAVFGAEAVSVAFAARFIGARAAGRDIHVDFLATKFERDEVSDAKSEISIAAGDPMLGAESLLAKFRAVLESELIKGTPIRRILIGDLRALRSNVDPEGLRRSIRTLVALVARLNIPLVIFETSERRTVIVEQFMPEGRGVRKQLEQETSVGEPTVVDAANVVIEIRRKDKQLVLNISLPDSGRIEQAVISAAP